MNARTQNMLMAARSLLENSGPELTSASDAFTVARKVLVVHDTIELVLAALCIEAGSGYKISENTSFHDLVGYVVKKYKEQDDDEAQNRNRAPLLNLNHARVRFKHHGDLLDAPTTYPLVEQAIEVIDLLCQRAVQLPLRAIDAIAAIVHEGIAEHLREAEEFILIGECQQALVSIARAMCTAFWDYDVKGVTVGEAEPDAALLLSGRGIDPASFLSMQRFLPKLYSPYDEDPKFDTRQYGHEANWTAENTRFCWNTALTVVLRLQHARFVPQALDFYDEFEDVITISADSTVCHRFKGYWFGDGRMPSEVIESLVGEVFSGKASGFYELRAESEIDMPLSEANWIRVENHNLQIGEGVFTFGTDEIWFNGEDVAVTYRENPLSIARKKYYAELEKGGDDDAP
jgi:hypothetical protein